MEREVRYCTSADGTRIAYSVAGEGPPLLDCPAIWESFANWDESMAVYDALWRGRSIANYDFRGVGLSQRNPLSITADDMAEDIRAVADATGFAQFALIASTFSSAPALMFAARNPERVIRLVLLRAIIRGTDVMPRANLDALIGLIRSNWEMASQAMGDLGVRESEDHSIGVRSADQLRKNMEPDDFSRMIEDLYESTDVTGLLEDIACPTLIMHRRDDTLTPFGPVQSAASRIPSARLVSLAGSGPISVGSDAPDNVRVIVDFFDEDPKTRATAVLEAPNASPTSFRAVLFTDLVGHAEMMSRLGDEAGRDVLREHERITREVLKANGGTEVKTMGDGFMASFGSVTKAVECAVALQRAFAEREGEPLAVRVGLNAGEPIEEDGDLFGATVILASRIAAKAEGGEILVADTVRGLCSGKGFIFADRGEFVAKGIEDPVRVYEVTWRD